MTTPASRPFPFVVTLSRFVLVFCRRAVGRAGLALALLPALLAPLGCSGSTPAAGDDAGTPTVTEASFSIALATDKLPVLQGATASVDVVLTRKGDFADAVTVAAVGLPAGATLAPTVIAAGQTTATLTVAADAAAPHSLPSPVTVQASAGATGASAPLTVTVYGPPGSVDTSFGGQGKAVVPVGAGDDYAYAVAVDTSGRVLVAGRAAEGLGDFALVRLDRDGTLDPTFGTGGKVTTDFAGGADTAYAVAVQADGKIVVAGAAAVTGTGQDFAVARYLDSGALDPTFGAAGKVTVAFGPDSDTAYALLLQPDGKIVLGGDSNQGSSTTGVDFALARFDATGALDPTFGTGGKVTTSVAANGARDSIYALTTQTVAGVPLIVAAGGEGDFQLARYSMTGALDATFGTGGKIAGMLGTAIGAARAVQITADGKILVAGHDNHDFALARLDAAGKPDPTFGTAGHTITAVSATNWDEVQAMAIAADGKILLGGWAYEGGSSSANFVLCRYGAEGLLDATFGSGGTVTTAVAAGMRSDQANAVVLQADARVPTVRVIAAGYASASNNDFVVARYWQ